MLTGYGDLFRFIYLFKMLIDQKRYFPSQLEKFFQGTMYCTLPLFSEFYVRHGGESHAVPRHQEGLRAAGEAPEEQVLRRGE